MVQASRWAQLAAYWARLGIPAAIVDVESTGGNLYEDRITEVALLRFENGRVRRYERLVNPQQPISAFISGLTGITDAMVRDAPVFSRIAAELLPLLRGTLLVAHNSRFDYTLLRHEFRRAGMDFAAPALCTVQLSRRLYPQFHKHNLDSIIERFGIAAKSRHRAAGDVLALADFLELSLIEKGAHEWDGHCRSLTNPKILPPWLPQPLAQQIYALPDTHGAAVWLDAGGNALAVHAHEKAFSEVSHRLHGTRSLAFAEAAQSIRFLPAVGSVHAVWLKAQLSAQYGLRPSESLKSYVTVQFAPDENERLQARVVPMGNGSRAQRPYGLFLHKKAAKRALSDWAQTHGLCPASLDILPASYAKGVPCPVQETGLCDGACRTAEGIRLQNSLIRRQAQMLPVADWGRAREVAVTETDALSGQSVTLHCAGGALALPDGRWYFDDTLPALLKAKFKQGAAAVEILSQAV